MPNKTFETNIGGRKLTVDIRNLAEQANGSVLVRYGDTLLLSTAVMSEKNKEGLNFFPLTVDYEERYYAAGKIKGPRYIRRESRPSDEATCNARLIDRAIRPLFPEKMKREVQAVVTVLSWDAENDPDILGLFASSLSLLISDIPWNGPVAALRVGMANDKFILNPIYKEREESKMDIVFAATERDEILINMIEGGFEEISEEAVTEAYQFVKPYFKQLIDLQKKIAKEIGKEKVVLKTNNYDPELEKEIRSFIGDKLEDAIFQPATGKKTEVGQLKEELISFIKEKNPDKGDAAECAHDFFEREINQLVHKNAIEKGRRADGRKMDELRKIDCEVGLLPRTHGSGLFCRGQTKALSILTLGAPGDHQILEGMEITGKKRFMHHYNFPPYSAGEVRPMRGPGRREIGHGMLAEKALLPLIPPFEEFPYTIRIVTEILSSNGSTSMASSSSSSLALMDAGVPIKAPVAGIALGLMSNEKGEYKILTDIQGPEDHHGDMDFKVAGTEKGITAMQMDVKINGISEKILKEALSRGKETRLQILKNIKSVIDKPRPELSPFAPRILILQINPDKIRDIIGPGGKIINEIIDTCGVLIDIEDSGKVFITAEKKESAEKAVEWINNITREVKPGEVFQGKVKRILDFGAFVEILPGQEGLVHISQLAPERVRRVEDVVNVGDVIPVKVIAIDDQGRINLSLKEISPNFLKEKNGRSL